MINLYLNLHIRPLPGDKFELLKEYHYKEVTVPASYCTNGADIPRFLWSFWPPNRPDYLPAVVVHDYLCDIQEYALAQQYFKEMLKELQIHPVTIFAFVSSTTLYLKLKYKY